MGRRRHRLTAALVLALAALSSGLPAATLSEPIQTVSAYLTALARFDHREVARIAHLEGAAGERSRQMREFERATHTTWTWRIVGVDDQTAHVLMTEDSDYYRLLGVGVRTQIVAYRVAAGFIVSSDIKFLTNQHGPARVAAEHFRNWLRMQNGGDDPAILEDGELKFDAGSASRMLPWLRQWVKRGRPTPPPAV